MGGGPLTLRPGKCEGFSAAQEWGSVPALYGTGGRPKAFFP
jgi:hypothetical protein